MTQEELQRQLLETQKRLVELQEQQNLRHEEEQAENKRKEEKHHDNNVRQQSLPFWSSLLLSLA